MSLSLEEQLIFNYLKIVSVSDVEETENVYKEIIISSRNEQGLGISLNTVLASINRVIKHYDLEIMEAVDESTGKKVHCLISTSTSTVAEKASFYSRHTCDLLSKIIHACVMSDNGSVTEEFCLNLPHPSGGNYIPVQESMERLIKDKWLVCKEGIITLGARCTLELEVSIKKQYPGYVKHCNLCKLFLVQGFTCPRCENHVHMHCLKKYCKTNKLSLSARVCPTCKDEPSTMEVEDEEMKGTGSGGEEPPAKKSKMLVDE